MYVNGEGETLQGHMMSHWRLTHRIHTGSHCLYNPQQGSVTWVFCFVFVKEEMGFLRVWLQALMFLRNHSLTDTCRVATNNKGYDMLMFNLLPTKKQDAFLPGNQGHSLFEELTPRTWSPVGLGVLWCPSLSQVLTLASVFSQNKPAKKSVSIWRSSGAPFRGWGRTQGLTHAMELLHF